MPTETAINLTPYATGGYDYNGTYYSSSVDAITSYFGTGEVEFFAFDLSGLTTDPGIYANSLATLLDTLLYTPSTSDPFDSHAINVQYSLVAPSDATKIVNDSDDSTATYYFYDDCYDLASVDVKASLGPAYPAQNNNVPQLVGIADVLSQAIADGDQLFIWASETSGGVSQVSDVSMVVLQCFAAGSHIALDDGERPVETVRVGDLVRTAAGGTRPVVWVGHRRVDCAAHPDPTRVRPVRIRRGAFGGGLPARDLLLSPDHAIHAEGVLIPVRYLIDGVAITQIAADQVDYFHIELDRHDIVLAEGLPVESYLETGERDRFDPLRIAGRPASGRVAQTWDSQGCAPLCVTGPVVQRVRARLRGIAPAGPPGWWGSIPRECQRGGGSLATQPSKARGGLVPLAGGTA